MYNLDALRKKYEDTNSLYNNMIMHASGLEDKKYTCSDLEVAENSDKAIKKYLSAILNTIACAVRETTNGEATRFKHSVATAMPIDDFGAAITALNELMVQVDGDWVSLKEAYPNVNFTIKVLSEGDKPKETDMMSSVIWADMYRFLNRRQRDFYSQHGVDMGKVFNYTSEGRIVRDFEDLYWFE